jgi:hypothetical protein
VVPVPRTFVLILTPLVAVPVVAVFLAVGGAVARPVDGTPVPVVVETGCRPLPACPHAFRRPLEC